MDYFDELSRLDAMGYFDNFDNYDIHDDIYMDDENDESLDYIAPSQAGPLRIPDDVQSSTQRHNIFHDDYDSKKRRRRFHLPGWQLKLRRMSWWGKRHGEWARLNVERELNAVLYRTPSLIRAKFNDLETNHRHDFELWTEFGHRYGGILGRHFPPNSIRPGHTWSLETLRDINQFAYSKDLRAFGDKRRKDLADYKDVLRRGLDKYESDYEAIVARLRRALESTEQQELVMDRRREKRIDTLIKTHGKTPRYLDNQRNAILDDIEDADDVEDDDSDD